MKALGGPSAEAPNNHVGEKDRRQERPDIVAICLASCQGVEIGQHYCRKTVEPGAIRDPAALGTSAFPCRVDNQRAQPCERVEADLAAATGREPRTGRQAVMRQRPVRICDTVIKAGEALLDRKGIKSGEKAGGH
jgi:hypothetical protein